MSHKKILNTLLLVIATVMLCLGCQFFVNKSNFDPNDVQVYASIDAPIDFDNKSIYSITKLKSDAFKEYVYRDNNVFYISTYEDLVNLADLVNNRFNYITDTTYNFLGKTIYLRNDIDLSGHYWEPIGWYQSIAPGTINHDFKGTFDGLGYSIYNMNIQYGHSTIQSQYIGFFGGIGDGTCIKNLQLINPTITFSLGAIDYEDSFNDFGFIVGNSNPLQGENGSEILNCKVSGASLNYNDHLSYRGVAIVFGGIVGSSINTDIFNCSFNGSFNIIESNDYICNIGGIAGSVTNSKSSYGNESPSSFSIRQCYSILKLNIKVVSETNGFHFDPICFVNNSSATCWSVVDNTDNDFSMIANDYSYTCVATHNNNIPHQNRLFVLPYEDSSNGDDYTLKERIIHDIYDDNFFVLAFYDRTKDIDLYSGFTYEELIELDDVEKENNRIWFDANFLQNLYANGGTFDDNMEHSYYETPYISDGYPILKIFLPDNNFYKAISDITPQPTRENYDFLGWSTTTSATTPLSKYGNIFDLDNYGALYAVWGKTQSELTINVNGGSYSGSTSVVQNKSTQYTLPSKTSSPALTKTGYILTGWSLYGGGTLNGNVYTFDGTDGTVTAMWALENYTITYNLNNSTLSWKESIVNEVENVEILLEGGNPNQTYNISRYGTSLALNYGNMDDCVNYPSNSDWTFSGWYNNTSYTGNQITQIEPQAVGDINLYAKFLNKTTLIFDFNPNNLSLGSLNKNDGSGANSIDEELSEYEVSPAFSYYSDLNLISEYVDLPIPTCTNNDYYFKGWKLSGGEIIKTYSGDLNTQFLPASSITMLAVWEQTPYKILLDYSNGNSPIVENALGSMIYEENKVIYFGSYGLQITIGDSSPNDEVSYVFEGWSLQGEIGTLQKITQNHSYTFDSGYPTNESYLLVIQAQFREISQVLVTFDYDGATGGANVVSKTVTYGSTYGPLPTPTKVVGDTQYIFDGWYLEDSFITKVFESTTVSTSKDHPLYAKFVQGTTVTIKASREAKSYSFIEQLEVIYKDSSGEQIRIQSTLSPIKVVVPINTRITLKATPMQGCTFDRWENDYGTEVSGLSVFSFYASNSETYWAYATAPEVYVTLLEYYANGTSRVIRAYYNKPYSYSIDDDNLNPEYRSNKNFEGWYYYPDFSEGPVRIGTNVNRTYDFYLYPKWKYNEVTATFNSNSGNILANINWTGSGATVTKMLMTGASYGVIPTSSDVSKNGYTFVSWHTDSALTSAPITPTSTVESTEAFTLYAKYIPVEYTIAYNGNATNPAFSGSTSSSIHQYGVAKNLTTNGFSRVDYDFVSWNTAADGMGTTYTNGQSVTNVVQSSGDIIVSGYTAVLYAQWERKEYTLTINIVPEVGEILIEQYDIYSDTTTTEVINTTAYEYTVYSGNNITLQAFDQVDVLTGEGNIVNQTQYLGYLFDNWNGTIYEKTTTVNAIRSNITQTANYKKVQYIINFGIKYDEDVSTESGTLLLSPNDIVSFGVDETVTARYTANLGYKISTGWEWDLVPLFSNLESQISVLVDSTYLSTLYSLVGTVSCENETQNLGNIYINTTKVEIPLQVIVIDAFRGEDVFEEIQNVISLSFKVSDTETDVVVLGDNLRVQPNTPNEDYIFQKWSLLTTANKPYHTMNTSSAFTFTINSKLIKTCYILPDIDYPNGRLVFEVTVARISTVTFETGDYGWGGVEKNNYIFSPYSGFFGENVKLTAVMNDGYTLNGYKYKYKSNEDVEYSEFVDIVANEYDEYELILEYDDIVIYPQYTQNAYTATLSIVQKSSNSTTVTLLDDWTSTDILTASVLTGNDYPNYNGTYTVTYQLFDISNYNVLGLYKNDYNGIPIDDVSDVDGSISKSNIITANTDFYIVIVSKINTVSLSLTLSSSDYVGGRAFEQDNPAVAYLTLNSDSTEYQVLELETGDSFTIHYMTNKGYNILGYYLNQEEIVLLTENSGTIIIEDFDSTKQGTYTFIFSKIQYTLSVNNNATKGNYSASVSNIYLYQTFDLTGSYNEGYKFVGFECNLVQYTETSDVAFVPEMIGESTTIGLTPLYINQYTIELDVNNPQYGQVETYINGQPTNFSGLYDANTLVKIELTTDLNHLLDSYLGIEASEVQLSSGTEKLYTIEFYLNANRDITLYLDGILLEVIVLNYMTMGECSFNLSSEIGENQYTVTARYEDLLNITVTANAGYRFDKLTANDIEITNPIEILENGTITVNYIKTYEVTTSVNSSAMGTVTTGGIYDENTELTIQANAKTGYEFVKWIVNGTDVVQPNEYVFVLTQDMDIVAHFAYIEYTFDFSNIENYFTVNELSVAYHYGDTVSITLTEKDVLFLLKNIFTNGVSVLYTKNNTSYTFSILVNNTNFIDKLCIVTADIINQYTITINTNPINTGLLEIDDAYAYSKNGNQYIYCEGDSLYLFADDNGYYEFSHYTNTASVDNIVNRNYTLLATQDMTIEAVFDAKSYQILVVAKELVGENMVDLNKEFECVYPSSAEVYTSINLELTSEPLGFEFLYFYYDEILSLSSMTSSIYIDQDNDYIVFAVFERINYSVTCTSGDYYTFTTTVSNAKVDDEITFVVETTRGYEVTGWTLNGNTIDSSVFTSNNITDLNSITFSFVPLDNDNSTIYNYSPIVSLKTYEINAVSNNETQGSAVFNYNETSYTETNVTYGDSITLIATLLDEDLYRFIYWMYNGQVLTTSSTYTVTNIDDNKAGTYTAVFGLLTGTISIQVTPERAYFGPTISVNGITTSILKNNDEVTVSINTNRITPGYVFVGWHHNVLSAVPASRNTSYTFTITKENRYLDSMLICEFAPKNYAINIDWSNGGSVVYSGGTVQGYLPATNNFNMATGLFVDMTSDTGYELGEITVTNGTQQLLMTNFIGLTEYGWQIDFNSIIAIAQDETTYVQINFVIMSFNIGYDISISNGNEFEAVVLPDETVVTYGTDVDVDASLILGFTFDGWYIGDVLVSEDLDFVLTSQIIFDNFTESGLDHNVLLIAHVSYITYNMVNNIYATPLGYGDLFANSSFQYKLNDTISLNAIPRTGFKFVGYYINNELVSIDRNYSMVFAVSMTEDDIQARFEAIQITVVIRGKTDTEYFTTENFGEVLSLKNGSETNTFLYNDSVRLLASSNYGYTFDRFNILDNDYTTSSFVYNSVTYQTYVFTITTTHLAALQNDILYIDAVYDVASFTINFSCNLDNLDPKPATTIITYKDAAHTGSVDALYGSTVKLNITISNNLFMMLGFYNGDTRIDVDGYEYEFVVNQSLNIVAKISPIISFANFDDSENKTYLRTYNFNTQALAIGTEVLCHESFADYVIITYGNSTVAPSNAGTYSVTARIDLPEFSEYESESVTLTIQKLTLTVTLIEDEIVTKEYDGFSSVSKSLVQDKLVLNGLIEGHENDTSLSFNNVTSEMYSDSIPKSEATDLCDLVIKDLMLTNTINFKLDIENNTIMFENKGKINKKRIYLNGITVQDIVYNEDDPTVKYGTYNPEISGVVIGDAVSLDLNSIEYEYTEYEIGRNKTITGSASLLGMDKDNYELIVANKSSHIYPYELTLETEGEGTFIIRDVNRNAFLPIDGTIEITNYTVDTPIYIELYQIIEPYLGRRNTFEIAYSVVIKEGTNTFNVTKPVQFEFVAPFKVDNDVNAYLIDGSNVTALATYVDDTQVLIMTTKLNNIVILKSKILFPVWLIILVTSIFVGLVTGSVVVIVILRKRKEVIFYQKDKIR